MGKLQACPKQQFITLVIITMLAFLVLCQLTFSHQIVHFQEAERLSHGNADDAVAACGAFQDEIAEGEERAWERGVLGRDLYRAEFPV